MKLKEFKERIDKLYQDYGDVDVCIDLSKNDLDLVETNNGCFTDNILSITETFETNISDGNIDKVRILNVNGICISNYNMEEK